jgi:3-phenylpropionate/cinnamic acid dioxygenase small subunit
MKTMQEKADTIRKADREELKGMMNATRETMEAAIHSIRSELQEAIQYQKPNVMVEVNHKTKGHSKELIETQRDFKVVKKSLEARTNDLMETIRDTREHLEIKLILFQDKTRNIISNNQDNMEANMEAIWREFQSQLEEVVARVETGRGKGACANAALPPKFDATTLWAVFQRQFETVAEQNCFDVTGEIHIFDHSFARPGH